MDAQAETRPNDLRGLKAHLSARLIGHETLIERLQIALLTGGHLLVEGAPGLAKTRAVKALADSVAASFARVQCTPDLMPADITGTPVYNPQQGSFSFVPGPVFHNLLLVDEINRAPPKVQSALLEAMAEGQVTAGGETHHLPDPFLVIATQNPIEHDGTFPLPEAQLDRFLLHVVLDLPGIEDERRILDLVEGEVREDPGTTTPALALGDLEASRRAVGRVHLAPELKDYMARLVVATRDGPLSEEIEHGASPRGTLALAAAARARAYLEGRDYAVPEDVSALACDALAHRMSLTWRAVAEGQTPRAVIARLLEEIEPL